AVVDGQIGPRLPHVAGEILLLEPAEAAMAVSNRRGVAAGDAHSEVGDGAAAEIVAEIEIAALAGRLQAVVVQANDLATKCKRMIARLAAVQNRVAETVNPPVHGNGRGRAQALIRRADQHLRADRVRL